MQFWSTYVCVCVYIFHICVYIPYIFHIYIYMGTHIYDVINWKLGLDNKNLLLSPAHCSDVCWSLRAAAWLYIGITYETLKTTGYWLLSRQYWFNSLGCNLGSQSFKSSPGDPNLQLKTRTNDFYLLGSNQLDPFANGVKAELFKQVCSLEWLEALHE